MINIVNGVVPSFRHEWKVPRSTLRSPARTIVSCVSVMKTISPLRMYAKPGD